MVIIAENIITKFNPQTLSIQIHYNYFVQTAIQKITSQFTHFALSMFGIEPRRPFSNISVFLQP